MNTTYLKTKKQRGFSIIAAIFLVVILALMGQGMVSLVSTSQQSVSQEISSAKAYMAARSCLEWAIYQAVRSSATGSHTHTFTDSGLFNTTCDTTVINLAAIDGHNFYNINVVGKYGGTVANAEYSRRELRLQLQP